MRQSIKEFINESIASLENNHCAIPSANYFRAYFWSALPSVFRTTGVFVTCTVNVWFFPHMRVAIFRIFRTFSPLWHRKTPPPPLPSICTVFCMYISHSEHKIQEMCPFLCSVHKRSFSNRFYDHWSCLNLRKLPLARCRRTVWGGGGGGYS